MAIVTIKDVAKRAGVSYATVSRALAGSPNVAEKTRLRVAEAAAEMGYTVNSLARSMVKGKTGVIGLVTGGLEDPFEARLAAAIELHAREYGASLLLGCSAQHAENEARLIARMAEQRPDGLILVPAGKSTASRSAAVLSALPCVFLSPNGAPAPTPCIAFDDFRGGVIGTDYLYALGHRDILFLADGAKKDAALLREEGYRAVCRDKKLTPRMLSFSSAAEASASVPALASMLFDAPHSFTAIFAENDSLALLVLAASAARGIRIPGSLSLLGYGDIPTCALPPVWLTTIGKNANAMALMAVDTLSAQIARGTEGGAVRMLSPVLIERGTCGKIEKTQGKA